MDTVDLESLLSENMQLRRRLEHEFFQNNTKIDEITRLNIQIAIYMENLESEKEIKLAILSKLGDVETELEFAKRQVS